VAQGGKHKSSAIAGTACNAAVLRVFKGILLTTFSVAKQPTRSIVT